MDAVRVMGGVMVLLYVLTRYTEVREERKESDKIERESERDSAILSQFVR